MTKILPEKNLAFDNENYENSENETLIFEVDKTDANEKYEIQAFKRNRLLKMEITSMLVTDVVDKCVGDNY